MGGKRRTKTEQSQNNTLDPFSKAQFQQNSNDVRGLLAANPFESYQGQFASGLTDLEQQARSDYVATADQGNQYLQDAAGTAQGVAGFTPQNVTAGQHRDVDLSAYQNPFTQNVIDNSLRDVNEARINAIDGTQASAVRAGAYGGSRHGIADGLTNERAIRTAGDLSANLNLQNYNQARQYADRDISNTLQADTGNANRALQGQQLNLGAAGLLGQLSGQNEAQAAQRANVTNQLGAQERAINDTNLQGQYQEFLRGEEDPYRRIQSILGLQGVTPQIVDSQGRSSTVERTSPGIGGILGTIAGGVAPFFGG